MREVRRISSVVTSDMGKMFIIAGLLFIILGLIMVLAPHVPLVGRLPGDFHVKGKNYNVYFPLASSIILSILLTLLLNLFLRK